MHLMLSDQAPKASHTRWFGPQASEVRSRAGVCGTRTAYSKPIPEDPRYRRMVTTEQSACRAQAPIGSEYTTFSGTLVQNTPLVILDQEICNSRR